MKMLKLIIIIYICKLLYNVLWSSYNVSYNQFVKKIKTHLVQNFKFEGDLIVHSLTVKSSLCFTENIFWQNIFAI